jgi:hypothetical protein
MSDAKKNWITVADSQHAWERPDHEPYRAWANFEFIAPDGNINEVGLTDEVQIELDTASCHSSCSENVSHDH